MLKYRMERKREGRKVRETRNGSGVFRNKIGSEELGKCASDVPYCQKQGGNERQKGKLLQNTQGRKSHKCHPNVIRLHELIHASMPKQMKQVLM